MRTTIDLPDDLFRRTKAEAAVRGSSVKNLIIRAVEREISSDAEKTKRPLTFPLIKSKTSRKLDLSDFDFDDLLLG